MAHSDTFDHLFSSFPPVTIEDWVKAASKEIGGKNPLVELKWTKGEVNGAPYYDKSSLADFAIASSFDLKSSRHSFLGARNWYNIPNISVLESKTSNHIALDHLGNGADGIIFDFQKNAEIALQSLLKNIEWPYCCVSFHVPQDADLFFKKLSTFLTDTDNEPSSLHGFFLWNTYPQPPQSLHNVVHNLSKYKNFHLLGISSQIENPIDQISDLLVKSTARIDELIEYGTNKNLIFSNLFYSTSIGTDFFLEIAKTKALRVLWFQLANAYGVKVQPDELFIHATSDRWSNKDFQPHENMIKGTTAGLAAILGGCNALTVDPGSESNAQVIRIARNVSNVLREESHLNKVADPTAGSYYIESLVQSIAHQAWEKFKETVSNK